MDFVISFKTRPDNRVLLYSTGNCTQYPVINHNGKEYEKEYIRELLCCTVEIKHNIVNQLYFNKIKKKTNGKNQDFRKKNSNYNSLNHIRYVKFHNNVKHNKLHWLPLKFTRASAYLQIGK